MQDLSLPFVDSLLSVQALERLIDDAARSHDEQTVDSATALSSLIIAWIGRHVLHEQVDHTTCCDCIAEASGRTGDGSRTPTASSSRATSISPLDDAYSDTLLDTIWTVDLELDARLDLVVSQNGTSLSAVSQERGSLQEQAKEARSRLAEIVRSLLHRNVLNRVTTAERLEVSLLSNVGLLVDERDFNRKTIRSNTARLYKQQKFNLLREENEGYSGLLNELTLGMGPRLIAIYDEGGVARLVEQESAQERNQRAQKVMNNVSALIGYFDLDPNRVLDLILDVFSANVVLHWPFFLALLACSPWAKGGDTRTSDGVPSMDVDKEVGEGRIGCVDLDVSNDHGHPTLAQLLGFKFKHYQHPDTKRSNQMDELYLTTAILIREGHIRLVDILPHLSPDEKGMTKMHEQHKDAMSDKVMNAKGNALSMAAPLTEDDDGSGALSNAADNAKANKSEPTPHVLPNQIVGLLKALLAIGQAKYALLILSRYTWLCGADPAIADLYSRMLEAIIAPAYAAHVSLSASIEVCGLSQTPLERYKYDNRKQELVPVPRPRLEVTAIAPEPLATGVTRFVFFTGDWTRQLPKVAMEEVLTDFVPLLRVLGAYLFRNNTLFQKVCRICRHALQSVDDFSEAKAAWLETVRNIILPALSMTSGNSGLVSEVWAVLRLLTYEERYSLYGEWKYSLYRRPELRVRQAEVEKEAKGILKRISSDNVKLSGRALAKASHANPTVFFTVALNQVQSYSNLIAPIVECAKYLTQLEYDVFGFSLIDALSNPEKDRMKQDGTSVSQWLQSLAAFTGTLYWRYTMDCTSVLQYIANQLKENNVKDLVIVRELILKMSGIEPLANLSDSQIAALTGGRILSMEVMMMANAGLATMTRINLRRSGARLMTALQQSRMLVPLLILIAQQRQACIHLVPDTEAHLKYLGNLFDTCQEILFQYVEFLNSQLDTQQYAELMPMFDDLCRRFELEPAIASHIVRPRLTLAVRTAAAKQNERRLRKELLGSQAKKTVATEGDKEDGAGSNEESKAETEKEEDGKTVEAAAESDVKAETEHDKVNGTAEAQTEEDVKMESDEASTSDEDDDIWRAALAEAYTAAENILSPEVQDVIGVRFYATFWQLSLSDLAVPSERYEQEIDGLQKIVLAQREGVRGANVKVRNEAQECIQRLRAELKERTLNHQATRRRLQYEKHHWFRDGVDRAEIVYAVLQNCFVPRLLVSPIDAIFAGRFLKLIHTCGTRNFASLTAYNKVIMELVPSLVFSTTENEARNLARFLQVVLADLTGWYKDEKKYVDEVQGENLPGFQIQWGERHESEEIPEADHLGYERFQAVTRKWHNMLRSTFVECFASGEYMRIRNAIVVMTRVANTFPLWESHGIELTSTVSTLVKDEERGDLKILGQGLLAMLNKEKRGWIPMPRKKKADDVQESKSDAAEKAETDGAQAANESSAASQSESKTDTPKPDAAQTQTHKLPSRPEALSRSSTTTNRRPAREERTQSAAAIPTTQKEVAVDAKREVRTGVQAARQAALNSLPNGGGGQTSKDSSSNAQSMTRDRSGGWDSPMPAPLDNRSTARPRDGAQSAPRSRAASPRQDDGRARNDARSNKTSTSRAPSESRDRAPSNDVRVSDRDRDRDRGNRLSIRERNDGNTTPGQQRDRYDRDGRYADARPREGDRQGGVGGEGGARSERQRDTYAAAARRREEGGARVERGDGGAQTPQEDNRGYDRDRDRGAAPRYGDRNGRDRRGDQEPSRPSTPSDSRASTNRAPPSGPRAASDVRRGPSSLSQSATAEDPRAAPRDRDRRPDHRDGNERGERPPTGPAASRPTEAGNTAKEAGNVRQRPAAQSEAAADGASPSGSRKRSLADRLAMSEAAGASGERSPGGGSSPRGPDRREERVAAAGREATAPRENEPNKRARISREADETNGDDAPRGPDRGISIHGQGRGNSGSGQYGAGAARRGPSGGDGYRHGPRDRYPSSTGPSGANRDRDRRRRRAGA